MAVLKFAPIFKPQRTEARNAIQDSAAVGFASRASLADVALKAQAAKLKIEQDNKKPAMLVNMRVVRQLDVI